MPEPVRINPFSMSTLGEREIADFRPQPVAVGRAAHPSNGRLDPENLSLSAAESDDPESDGAQEPGLSEADQGELGLSAAPSTLTPQVPGATEDDLTDDLRRAGSALEPDDDAPDL